MSCIGMCYLYCYMESLHLSHCQQSSLAVPPRSDCNDAVDTADGSTALQHNPYITVAKCAMCLTTKSLHSSHKSQHAAVLVLGFNVFVCVGMCEGVKGALLYNAPCGTQ